MIIIDDILSYIKNKRFITEFCFYSSFHLFLIEQAENWVKVVP